LAQPGGNVTGLSLQATDLGGKRLELLREIVPRLRRLAIMVDVGYSDSVLEMGEVQAAARTLSIEVAPVEIRRAEDIGPAIEAVKAKADALYVVVGALIGAYRTRIITSALGARLPTLFSNREQVQAGGLMSYGPSVPDMFHRTADLVDKILRGAKPGDIPVEQPTRFELVINLTTARALGLEVPLTLLARADEVMRWRAVFGLPEGEGPRHGTGAAVVLHDARATTAVRASYSGVNRSSTCKLHQTK
jgi:putative ABC transport system substrate-binding protein